MRKFSDRNCRENQNTHFTFNKVFSSLKLCRLWDNVETYFRARQTTDGNIIRRMRFACWITEATNTHSEYATHIVSPPPHCSNGHANLPLLYVIRTLPVVLVLWWEWRRVCVELQTHRDPLPPCPSLWYINQYGADVGVVLTGKILNARTRIFSNVTLCYTLGVLEGMENEPPIWHRSVCLPSGEPVTATTDMRRLTTGIRSEKCVVRWFRRCANVLDCTYTNLDSIAYYTLRLNGITYCC